MQILPHDLNELARVRLRKAERWNGPVFACSSPGLLGQSMDGGSNLRYADAGSVGRAVPNRACSDPRLFSEKAADSGVLAQVTGPIPAAVSASDARVGLTPPTSQPSAW